MYIVTQMPTMEYQRREELEKTVKRRKENEIGVKGNRLLRLLQQIGDESIASRNIPIFAYRRMELSICSAAGVGPCLLVESGVDELCDLGRHGRKGFH